METVTVLFWFTLLTCLTGLGRILLFARATGFGWVAVFLLILLVVGEVGVPMLRLVVVVGMRVALE